MKLRSAAGGSAHYYKFTGVTEIQCWTLYGESPGSLRNEDFNDKLRNEVPTPRTQGNWLGDVCSGKVFRVVWLFAAAGPKGSQICSSSGLLLHWLYSMATDVALSSESVSP